MWQKISDEHRQRGAMVYVRQSTLAQIDDHPESHRRQYALSERAREMGFHSVSVIDEDQGRSGSGLVERPGFTRLVGAVCAGSVGAVFCLEAARLARNGRDWHHLIDLCALVGAVLVDLDGVYDPRLTNDRLLLGLKGTMSEYELSLLRQRALEARQAKARRGELRFGLPVGLCWGAQGRVEIEADQRVVQAVELAFAKFRELGSVRQVLLWFREQALELPALRRPKGGPQLSWSLPTYSRLWCILTNPFYAGAYAFGRTAARIRLHNGQVRRTLGHRKPPSQWSVLLRDHHPGYISWQEYAQNQQAIAHNTYMKPQASKRSGRGGRALLSGMLRCARCGRTMRVKYGSGGARHHQYVCRGEAMVRGNGPCLGIAGARTDELVSEAVLQAVDGKAVEAALAAAERVSAQRAEVQRALELELEQARYDARLAVRRYEAVDPDNRLVAAELERRWNGALGQVADLEGRISEVQRALESTPIADRTQLLALAADLPAIWNDPATDMRCKQRLLRVLLEEVVANIDGQANETVLLLHWVGGCHCEIRFARARRSDRREELCHDVVAVVRRMAGRWTDHQIAATLNRRGARSQDGSGWTGLRVQALRERLGLAACAVAEHDPSMLTVTQAARLLGVSTSAVYGLIRRSLLPATQVVPGAPWQIPHKAIAKAELAAHIHTDHSKRSKPRLLVDEHTLNLPGT